MVKSSKIVYKSSYLCGRISPQVPITSNNGHTQLTTTPDSLEKFIWCGRISPKSQITFHNGH
jgi:hypothetical protein